MVKKKEILLQVPVLEATEQRYGLYKGYVLNFSFIKFCDVCFQWLLCVKRMIGDNKE